jgi:ABC-type multidrug transport system permease subunit
MQELDPFVFLAVFQEMLGFWLWVLVAVAALGIGSFIYTVIRDRGLRAGRFVAAQLIGVAGGFAALFFMWWITSSSIRDVGGAIDVVLVLAIWTGGFLGGTILSYGLIGLALAPRRRQMVTIEMPSRTKAA